MAQFLKQFECSILGKEVCPAYLLDEEWISFGEVNALANQLAHWFLTTLSKDELVVGVHAETSLMTGPLLLGILKAGKVFLGLDPAFPASRIRYMTEKGGCAIVLTDGIAASDQFAKTRVLTIDDAISLARSYPTSNPPTTMSDNSPAYITFTSGSTGLPKAVLAPLRQIDNRFTWMWEAYPFGGDEVCCHRMPLSFVDSIWEILGPICQGIPVALISAKRVRGEMSLVEQLAHYQISRIWMLPAQMNALVEAVPDLGERLPKLQFWVCTGDSLFPGLAAKLFRSLPHARLFNLYGTSEVWDATWYEVPADGVTGLFVPIGKAITDVDVTVVDETGRPVPKGTVGEIAVGGKGLALGYLTGHSAKWKPFDNGLAGNNGALYLTGDIGHFREDENLVFLGRRQSIVSREGQHVSLLEVESALIQHPLVQEGAVGSDKADSGAEVISAYFRVKQGAELTDSDLISFLRMLLPTASLPDRVLRVSRFPMTPSGKIDRRLLKELEPTTGTAPGETVASRHE